MAAEYVTPEDFAVMVQSLGPDKAEAWRAKRGIVIQSDDAAQEGLDMDETDYEDDTVDDTTAPSLGGALSTGDVNSALSAYNKAQADVSRQIQANIDLLTAGSNRLRDQRMGPSESEKWFAIAAALGKPTKTGSFGESLGNVNEVLADQFAAQRKAQTEREDLLERYGMQIGGEQLRMLQAGATQAGQTYRAALSAAKPKNPYSGAVWDAEAQRWRMLPGAEGGPPVLTPEQVAQYARDPRNRGMEFYTTDGRPMRIK